VLFLVPLEGEVSKECVLLSSVGLSSFPWTFAEEGSGRGRDLELVLVDKGYLLTSFSGLREDDLLNVSSWGLLVLCGCSKWCFL
jgi:hypothetical protein